MPEFFDIHSHLHFPDYDKDREEVIARMLERGVWTISVGVNLETSKKEIEIAEKHKNVYTAIGLHPHDGPDDVSTQTFNEEGFAKLVVHPKVVAIGECGLDYGRSKNDPNIPSDTITEADKIRQKKDFEKQIDFAAKYDKPMMLHVRNAHEDVLDILAAKKKIYGEKLRGNAHFFTGTTEIEQKYLNLGFSVSFTGVITFVKAYDEAVKYAPLDMIMSETDAPFVAPIPHRGERNEPSYVEQVVEKMAQIKGKTEEEMQKILVNNAIRVFSIPL